MRNQKQLQPDGYQQGGYNDQNHITSLLHNSLHGNWGGKITNVHDRIPFFLFLMMTQGVFSRAEEPEHMKETRNDSAEILLTHKKLFYHGDYIFYRNQRL
ncbi:hypothetical protein D3C81_1829690 [compost metagenome]